MRLAALLLSATFYSSLVGLVSGLFQDEAFQIDYQYALLGRPTLQNTFFHQPSVSSKASLIYTLSEKLVLGALNPKDGSIVWRQDLGDGLDDRTGVRGFLRAANNSNVVVSAIGDKIRAWEASDGRLIWEWEGRGTVKSLTLLEVDPMVILEDQGIQRIARLNAMTGKMIWEIADDR